LRLLLWNHYGHLRKPASEKGKTSRYWIGLCWPSIALAFAKKIKVVGFDTDQKRISLLNQSVDPAGELMAAAFNDADIVFTNDPKDLEDAGFLYYFCTYAG
jgi:UDP-N-acetyl-D-galactosamine dehydrogenase